MREAKPPGMQCKSSRPPRPMLREIGTITLVSENRVPGLGKVNADLVAAARFKPHPHKGCPANVPLDAIHRHGTFTFVGHIRRVSLQTRSRPQTSVELPLGCLDFTRHDRRVLALRFPPTELLLQLFGDPSLLAEHQQSRGTTIEPMHHPGPLSGSFQIPIYGFEERVPFAMIGRHREHRGSLVDDDEIFIFIDEPKPAALARARLLSISAVRIVPDLHEIPRCDRCSRLRARITIQRDAARVEQAAHLAARAPRELLNDTIDPPGVLRGDRTLKLNQRHNPLPETASEGSFAGGTLLKKGDANQSRTA